MVAISMLGIKDTPPKRGTAFSCTFRASGVSYSFLFLQNERICGIIMNPQIALMVNAKRLIKVYVDILLVFLCLVKLNNCNNIVSGCQKKYNSHVLMVVLQNNLTTRSRLCVFFCIFVIIKFGKYYRLLFI